MHYVPSYSVFYTHRSNHPCFRDLLSRPAFFQQHAISQLLYTSLCYVQRHLNGTHFIVLEGLGHSRFGDAGARWSATQVLTIHLGIFTIQNGSQIVHDGRKEGIIGPKRVWFRETQTLNVFSCLVRYSGYEVSQVPACSTDFLA